MRRFVACQNLERYRRLLANETNAERRATLESLLANEERRLADLTDEENPEEAKEPLERRNLA